MATDEEIYRDLVTKRFLRDLDDRIAKMSEEDLKRAIEFEKKHVA